MATLEMEAIVFKGKEPFHLGFFFWVANFRHLVTKKKRGVATCLKIFFGKTSRKKKLNFPYFNHRAFLNVTSIRQGLQIYIYI